MQKRHKDRKRYFNEQVYTTKNYIIPYIEHFVSVSNKRVLEIGCGEGGNLLPFIERNCKVHGVDLAQDKISNGQEYLHEYISNKQCKLEAIDIFDTTIDTKFDIIFYRDVIEHIPDHKALLQLSKKLLNSGGIILVIFPPWQNPFGGHQQMLQSKVLSKIPYIHLLPDTLYRNILEANGERDVVIDELIGLNKSKVTVESFKKYSDSVGLNIKDLRLYFINPNYEVKFNLKPVIQSNTISKIPILRNFLSTTCYSILTKNDREEY